MLVVHNHDWAFVCTSPSVHVGDEHPPHSAVFDADIDFPSCLRDESLNGGTYALRIDGCEPASPLNNHRPLPLAGREICFQRISVHDSDCCHREASYLALNVPLDANQINLLPQGELPTSPVLATRTC